MAKYKTPKQHRCTRCGQMITDESNKRVDASRMHYEHISCPTQDTDRRPISTAEARAIRAFLQGKIDPCPWIGDGEWPGDVG